LTIEVTGTKNPDPAATGAWIVVDAFDVTLPSSAPPVTRLQEKDPPIVYTATSDWVLGSRFSFDSGEFAMLSTTTGATVTLTFTGTSVRWIGHHGSTTGVARISLDGTFVAQIDTRAPLQEEFQAAIFSAIALTPGTHTLTIEVIGRNGEPPGATVDPVVVDAFDIY
jgi:hypothetical protein